MLDLSRVCMFVSSSDRLNGRVLSSNSFNTIILFEVGLMPDFDRMDSVAVIYVFFFFLAISIWLLRKDNEISSKNSESVCVCHQVA